MTKTHKKTGLYNSLFFKSLPNFLLLLYPWNVPAKRLQYLADSNLVHIRKFFIFSRHAPDKTII